MRGRVRDPIGRAYAAAELGDNPAVGAGLRAKRRPMVQKAVETDSVQVRRGTPAWRFALSCWRRREPRPA